MLVRSRCWSGARNIADITGAGTVLLRVGFLALPVGLLFRRVAHRSVRCR